MLWVVLALSSQIAIGAGAQAHEVSPSIMDVRADGQALQLTVRLNAEALLAGLDLDGLDDTDRAENSGNYRELRALDPAQLGQALPRLVAAWSQSGMVLVGHAAAPLTLTDSQIPHGVAKDAPRLSTLVIRAPIADGAASFSIHWPKGAGALILRQQGVEDPFTAYLQGDEQSPQIALHGGGARGAWASLVAYVPVGVVHIVPRGLDHILFVLGLFLFSPRLRPILAQVSLFTLAHTVTLALGALGIVRLSASVVEPLIAASIIFIAVENIIKPRLGASRLGLIFGFGLLHGLGFASVLGAFGLPQGQFIPALVGFNIGVELGQLAVISLAALLLWPLLHRSWYRRAVAIPASAVIALTGAYWLVERIIG